MSEGKAIGHAYSDYCQCAYCQHVRETKTHPPGAAGLDLFKERIDALQAEVTRREKAKLDAAHLAGVRAGLEAAAKKYEQFNLHHRAEATLALTPEARTHHWSEVERTQCVVDQIRAIDPVTVPTHADRLSEETGDE